MTMCWKIAVFFNKIVNLLKYFNLYRLPRPLWIQQSTSVIVRTFRINPNFKILLSDWSAFINNQWLRQVWEVITPFGLLPAFYYKTSPQIYIERKLREKVGPITIKDYVCLETELCTLLPRFLRISFTEISHYL